MKNSTIIQWSDNETVYKDVNDKILGIYNKFNIRIPVGPDGKILYGTMMDRIYFGLQDLPGYSVSVSATKENKDVYNFILKRPGETGLNFDSASNLADVSNNSEARTIQNKPC